jgi:hypothetical protein
MVDEDPERVGMVTRKARSLYVAAMNERARGIHGQLAPARPVTSEEVPQGGVRSGHSEVYDTAYVISLHRELIQSQAAYISALERIRELEKQKADSHSLALILFGLLSNATSSTVEGGPEFLPSHNDAIPID